MAQQSVDACASFLAGGRKWVIDTLKISVQVRFAACGDGAMAARWEYPLSLLARSFILMGRRHRVIGHWFESNLLHQMGQ